jgi:hypothetical protein
MCLSVYLADKYSRFCLLCYDTIYCYYLNTQAVKRSSRIKEEPYQKTSNWLHVAECLGN